MITIVKIGGAVIDDESELKNFLTQFAQLEGKKILVHGGGKSGTELSIKMGIPAEMISGRRVTNADTLKLITMIYAGWINKSIVARLQAVNCNALGISGADGNLMQSKKRSSVPVDYGFVGDPIEDEINSELLKKLLENEWSPVIAPVTHDGNGQLLNTNADTIASAIALSLAKTEKIQLIYCFEKNGVLENTDDPSSFFSELTNTQFEAFTKSEKIHSGMLPKLKAGFHAKKNGVERVIIGNAKYLIELSKQKSPCTTLEI